MGIIYDDLKSASSKLLTNIGLGTKMTGAAAVIASNPIGWAIVGGVVVGGLATYAYNHNWGGMKDGANNIGKSIDSGLNSIGKFFGGMNKHA